MASSTTRPVASVMPNKVSVLMEKPSNFTKHEGADERNRSGDKVNHRRPPVAEKDKDHQDDQQDRRTYREDHVANGFTDRVGGVECELVVHPGREVLREPFEFGYDPPVDVEGVGR